MAARARSTPIASALQVVSAQAGAVDQDDELAVDVERHLLQVAGRAGLVRHDRGVGARTARSKARFAGVRRTRKYHAEAVSEDAALSYGSGNARDVLVQRQEIVAKRRWEGAYVSFVGKVELGFDLGAQVEKALAPAIHFLVSPPSSRA